jgi:hypothetical protein
MSELRIIYVCDRRSIVLFCLCLAYLTILSVSKTLWSRKVRYNIGKGCGRKRPYIIIGIFPDIHVDLGKLSCKDSS